MFEFALLSFSLFNVEKRTKKRMKGRFEISQN